MDNKMIHDAFNFSPVPTVVCTKKDLSITTANKAFLDMAGCPLDRLEGNCFDKLNIWPHPEDYLVCWQALRGKISYLDTKINILDASGNILGCSLSAKDITCKNSPHVLITLIDVIENNRPEILLKQDQTIFQRIAESMSDYIYTVDFINGYPRYTHHEPTCEAVTGYTPEDFSRDPELWVHMIPEEERKMVLDKLSKFLSGYSPQSIEHRIIRKNGSTRLIQNILIPHYNKKGTLTCYDGLIRDITENKISDIEQAIFKPNLNRINKLETLSTMASGLVHDLNNILTSIIGYADIIRADPGQSKTNIDHILYAGDMAKKLIEHILYFGRSKRINRQPLDMNQIVKDVLVLLRSVIPRYISIIHKYKPTLLGVVADPIEIYQIILNLCMNAYQAIEKKTGTIELSLTSVFNDDVLSTMHPEYQGRPYVKFSVNDTGSGIDERIIKHIFEPFFTTKGQGKGTGLGLATVKSIINDLGGDIFVRSTPGIGASFDIFLPQSFDAISDSSKARIGVPHGNGQCVLVVDDEQDILTMCSQMLRELGYKIEAYSRANKAFEEFRSSPQRFDLVITDEIMPDMGGCDFALNVLKVRPNIPIILISGYKNLVTPEKAKAIGFRCFVEKPFSYGVMAGAIFETLNVNENRDMQWIAADL